MFQIINDAKSASSASIVPVKIHVSPLSNQKAHVLQITQNSPTIFRFGLWEMETPNFTVNCTKSAQFVNPYCESREISPIRTNF